MPNQNSRPNILCFVTDQHRADHLGCAGNAVLRTPNLDRIAASGVRFARTYVSNPLCMPSRSTLFTGLSPRGHRVRTNGIPLDRSIPTLPEALRRAGYRTHSVGKLHLHPFLLPAGTDPARADPAEFPEAQPLWKNGRIDRLPEGFLGLETAEYVGGHGHWLWGDYVRWLEAQRPGAFSLLQPAAARRPLTGAEESWKCALPEELHVTKWIADRTIDFLRREGRAGRPFFLWCSIPDPHHPYDPPAPWSERYDPASVPVPAFDEKELDQLPAFFREAAFEGLKTSGRFEKRPTRMKEDHLREIIAHTFGMIALLDHHVGRVLDTVQDLGLRDDTVIVFLSDHGELMGDHGLMNKGPFHFEGLLRVSSVWSWPGHFPAGSVPEDLASLLDFAPTILDLAGVPIPEGPAPEGGTDWAGLTPWPGVSLVPRLARGEAVARDAVIIENDEDYLGLRLRTLVTRRHKLTVYAGRPFGEMFDLENDPGERENLWHEPGAAPLRRELTGRLLDLLAATDPGLPRKLTHA